MPKSPQFQITSHANQVLIKLMGQVINRVAMDGEVTNRVLIDM